MVKKPMWPREIIEIPPPSSRDPRNDDPHQTQKITRDQLEQALGRTKSGFRRAVRESEPEIDAGDPRTEPADPKEPAVAETQPAAEPEAEPKIPDPIIRIKDEELPDASDFGEIPALGTPIPRSRRAAHVVTPSTSLVPGVPFRPPSPARAHVVLAIVVALLTTAALAIGYIVGRASL